MYEHEIIIEGANGEILATFVQRAANIRIALQLAVARLGSMPEGHGNAAYKLTIATIVPVRDGAPYDVADPEGH